MTSPAPQLADIDPVVRAHRMLRAGRSREATAMLDAVLPRLRGFERAHALILRVAATYNLDARPVLVVAVDKAFAAVRDRPEPYLHGHLHALAALAAHRGGQLERAVTHLVTSARFLSVIEADDENTACAWHDLAMAYSYTGFHGYAARALERATVVGREVGLPEELLPTPGIRLRGALWHDHHGDTEACLRVLDDLTVDLAEHRRTGALDRIKPAARAAYGYALSRLSALGRAIDADPRPLFLHLDDATRMRDLARLGEVCLAIAAGTPGEALERLAASTIAPESLGPGEAPRLTALAYARAGDFQAAYEADRNAFLAASAREAQLREAFVEGIAARLEHQDLRLRAARFQTAALTDALTGLPNRRHLEEYVENMIERGEHAVVGVCDMDGFKAVNTHHGHLAGDMVLQRVGEIINSVLRRGDFLARYGGDEFVVVLPRTKLVEADDVAHRIVHAVGGNDWTKLAPGTPVAVSVGWAEVAGPRLSLRQALVQAFEAADRAMLRAKTRTRAS